MKRVLLLILLSGLAACSALQGHLQAPDVALVGLRIGQSEGMYQTVFIDLMITNPNATSLKLNAINYHVRIEGRDLINGVSREPLEIAAGEAQKYTVPASISLMSGFGLIRDITAKPKNKINYELLTTLEPSGLFSMPITVKKVDTFSLSQ